MDHRLLAPCLVAAALFWGLSTPSAHAQNAPAPTAPAGSGPASSTSVPPANARLLAIGGSDRKVEYSPVPGLEAFLPDADNAGLYKARSSLGFDISLRFFDAGLEIGQDDAFIADLKAKSPANGRMFATRGGDFLFYELTREEGGQTIVKYSVRGLLGPFVTAMECLVTGDRAGPRLKAAVEALFEETLKGLRLN